MLKGPIANNKQGLLIGSLLAIIGLAFYWCVPPPPVESSQVADTTHVRISAPYVYKTSNPFVDDLLTAYDSFLTAALNHHQAPGVAVAIIQDTSIIYLKGLGIRDVRNAQPININTVFRIASVSKSFASLLTGILVDEKKLNWDDPVVKYLPDFKLKSVVATQTVTLRHVLSHTIGLPYHAFTSGVDEGDNFDSLVYHLRDLDLIGKPGEVYSYQNVGYSLIGKVIQSATGKSYQQNLQEKIFQPLHMQYASASFRSIMDNENTAKPHRYRNGWVALSISPTYYDVGPAGGVNASISDMARWLQAITVNPSPVVKQETLSEIFHSAVSATSKNYNFRRWKPVRSAGYALGWRVVNFKDDTLNYHGGYVNGYRSEVAIDRKDNIAICVLVNSPGALADLSIPTFFAMYAKRRGAIREWEKRQTIQ